MPNHEASPSSCAHEQRPTSETRRPWRQTGSRFVDGQSAGLRSHDTFVPSKEPQKLDLKRRKGLTSSSGGCVLSPRASLFPAAVGACACIVEHQHCGRGLAALAIRPPHQVFRQDSPAHGSWFPVTGSADLRLHCDAMKARLA